MSRAIDITNMRFGRLVAKSFEYSDENNVHFWRCLCDCGNEIVVRKKDLHSGNTKSCGCYKNDICKQVNTTHGMGDTKIYRIWRGLKSRCYCNSQNSYKNYGARGITVCDGWKNSFESFYQWAIENGYREEVVGKRQNNITIERIDNSKGYFPENCRWATAVEQANNRRTNTILYLNGEPDTIANWSRRLQMPYHYIQNWRKRGKTFEDIVRQYNNKFDRKECEGV